MTERRRRPADTALPSDGTIPSANCAWFRFYEELNDFLTREKRKVCFPHPFDQQASVKDMIESLGVPHTEIDLILANGQSVDFTYRVRNNDRISVYPVFETLDISPVIRLRPAPLRRTRFVLDTHLGRLAAYLRMSGFDTLYRNDYDDRTLATVSTAEHRILLTRDRKLLMRRQITHGYFVRHTRPGQQLVEILKRFDLMNCLSPFSRCLRCNGELGPVPAERVLARVPPVTRSWCREYRQCAQCGKIYWKGTHYRRMRHLIDEVRALAKQE